MSPIEVIPVVPIHRSNKPESIELTDVTEDRFIVFDTCYVLPKGRPLNHIVKVTGFLNEPGGMIESERQTTGHSQDENTLTTPDDKVLCDELGSNGILIDLVLYWARNMAVNETKIVTIQLAI